MKTYQFPYLAFALGVLLLPAILLGSHVDDAGATRIPLLTLLIASEAGFIVSGVGFAIGMKHRSKAKSPMLYTGISLMCGLLAVRFLFLGIDAWPL